MDKEMTTAGFVEDNLKSDFNLIERTDREWQCSTLKMNEYQYRA